jgi:hypothetical protein
MSINLQINIRILIRLGSPVVQPPFSEIWVYWNYRFNDVYIQQKIVFKVHNLS